jgi:hypothetical protein
MSSKLDDLLKKLDADFEEGIEDGASVEDQFLNLVFASQNLLDLSNLEVLLLLDRIVREVEIPEVLDGRLYGLTGLLLNNFGLAELKLKISDLDYSVEADLIEIYLLRYNLYVYKKLGFDINKGQVKDVLRVELEGILGSFSVADRVKSLINETRSDLGVDIEEIDVDAFMDKVLGDLLDEKRYG